MKNSEYITKLNDLHADLHEVNKKAKALSDEWIKNNAPYKAGAKITAPFAVAIQYPYLYKKQIQIANIAAEEIEGFFWVWRVTAAEGRQVFTWFEPMEDVE